MKQATTFLQRCYADHSLHIDYGRSVYLHKQLVIQLGLQLSQCASIKVPILKKQERIIGNVKYQEYLFKPPSIKDLDRNCWQSLEKYKVLVWGYHHGHQIISSEGNTEKTKMFTYSSSGECEPVKK